MADGASVATHPPTTWDIHRPRGLAPTQVGHGVGGIRGDSAPVYRHTKSRNGCVTCKARRRKCDETKPACQQCTRRRVTCGGYNKDLRWKEFEQPTAAAARPSRGGYSGNGNGNGNGSGNAHGSGNGMSSRPAPGRPSTNLLPTSSVFLSSTASHNNDRHQQENHQNRQEDQEQRRTGDSSRDLPATTSSSSTDVLADISLGSAESMVDLDMLFADMPSTLGRSSHADDDDNARAPTPSFLHLLASSPGPDHPLSATAGPTGMPPLDMHGTMDLDHLGPDLDGDEEEDDNAGEDDNADDNDGIEDIISTAWPLPLDDAVATAGCNMVPPSSPAVSMAGLAGLNGGGMLPLPSFFGGGGGGSGGADCLLPPSFALYQQPRPHTGSPEHIAFLFNGRICEVMCICDGIAGNPWRRIVWPLAQDHAALYHAVAAMTCFQDANRSPQFRARGLQHLNTSIQQLYGVHDEDGRGGGMRLEVALAVTLFLGFAQTWYYPRSSTGIRFVKSAKSLLQKALTRYNQRAVQLGSQEHRRGPQLPGRSSSSSFAPAFPHSYGANTSSEVAFLRLLANTWIYMDVITRFTCRGVQKVDTKFMITCQRLLEPPPLPPQTASVPAPAAVTMPPTTPLHVDLHVDPLMGIAASLFPLIGRVADLVNRVCARAARRTAAVNGIAQQVDDADDHDLNPPGLVAEAVELQLAIERWTPGGNGSGIGEHDRQPLPDDSTNNRGSRPRDAVNAANNSNSNSNRPTDSTARPPDSSNINTTTTTTNNNNTNTSSTSTRQTPSLSSPAHSIPSASASDLVQTANAYKWATLLLLYQAVPELPRPRAHSPARLARQVLVLLATVPLGSRAIIFPVLPLLVAGCEATARDDREWVRSRWRALAKGNTSGIVDRCLELTREVWRRRGVGSQDSQHRHHRDHRHRHSSHSPHSTSTASTNSTTSTRNSSPRRYAHTATVSSSFVPDMIPDILPDLLPDTFDDEPNNNRHGGSSTNASTLAGGPLPPLSHSLQHPPLPLHPPEYTVRSTEHWLSVMREWGWEVMLG